MTEPHPSTPPHQPALQPAEPPAPLQRFLFWLAGARWELLRHCPASEQERVAVQGSTVLVPTAMAFLGMYFFARSRFQNPPALPVFAVSILWAFVILNTDRILISMYRPFLPLWRRIIQVLFRLGLATVVSVAISFPFCLDQYRPAIRFRYQTELQAKLNSLRDAESAGRKILREDLLQMRSSLEADRRKLEADHQKIRESLEAQLPPLEKAQTNPELYADGKMEEERRRASDPDFVAPASGTTLNTLAKLDGLKESLERHNKQIEEAQGMHRRLVEALAREELGLPNEFYPEPKKPGDGPRLKDMKARDLQVQSQIRKLEAELNASASDLAAGEAALARSRLTDKNSFLDTLAARRGAFVAEAQERETLRKDRLSQVRLQLEEADQNHSDKLKTFVAHRQAMEDDRARAQRRHDDTHLPPIQRLEAKINGLFDPMEETIGLYKVIFSPPPDMPEEARMQYRWAAGVFQFLVVFGTLFLLDLVPIASKLLSRPGPYDVLVEHSEFVVNANWRDFARHFAIHGNGWPGTPPQKDHWNPADAALLLHAHFRPSAQEPFPAKTSRTQTSEPASNTELPPQNGTRPAIPPSPQTV